MINILDDTTINKIAAGEVVERPVSVVKELVENSIDAGSSSISIEIKGGGIDLIRVTDNGCGIDHDNIPKAFLRHATSKIETAEDIMHVMSLGFRGEALASVAAVSRVELMSKTGGSLLGYRYVIHGGRMRSFDEAGIPDGTSVIVRDLFYNTPARKKFLKSASTEANYITELIERMILSHPDISFKYTLNGNIRLSSNGMGDIMSDIYTVFGRDIQHSVVENETDTQNCHIRLFAGKPAISRGNRNYEIFYVNGRFVKSRILSAAVEEAYKPFLMLHRFPFVIIYLDIPQELLDVNVHPAKTEIRFSEERYVHSCVAAAVSEALNRRELIPEAVSDKPCDVKKEPEQELAELTIDIPEPFESKRIETYRQKAKEIILPKKEEKIPVQETLFREGLMAEENRPKIHIIGQVFDTYWISEYEEKMYIVDQHAAHEKVLYERLAAQIAQNSVISQLISPPYIVSLSASQEEVVKDNLELFEQTGFCVSHFGGREYALSAVPAELFGLSEQDYFLSIVDDLCDNRKEIRPAQIKDRIATMACKAAVKGNMKMNTAEASALLNELFGLENPYNCPHGRPTIISFSKSDLEKMFKRIV